MILPGPLRPADSLRTPLTLVTGFLGSGKTTLLRRIAAGTSRRRLVYLVNEFSSLDVDSSALREVAGEVVSLAGGSLFCRCLVTELISKLRGIAGTAGPAEGPPDGLVVEASGVADPRVVGQMLRETRLDAAYHIASIVTVVDPGSFLKLLRTLPSVRAQVEAADVALINKCDLFPEQTIRAAEAEVRQIRAGVPTVRTVRCAIDLSLLDGPSAAAALGGEYAACRDPRFEARAVRPGDDVDLKALEGSLLVLREEVYRLKGHVLSGGELHHVDFDGRRLAVSPVERGSRAVGLALILRAPLSAKAQAFLRDLTSDEIS